MPSIRSLSAISSAAAALALLATPAQAAELGSPVAFADSAYAPAPAWGEGAATWEKHRRYRWRHRDRGLDAGDVIAGVLILGGIAAIADAATRDSDERYRTRDWRYPPPRSGGYRDGDARGIDAAVSLCVDEIERDVRVDTVDAVDRTAQGWRVAGSLYDGQRFTCAIGADGRIDAIDYGAGGYEAAPYGAGYEPGEDAQYDEDRYAAAWADIDRQRASSEAVQPAYPGGPVVDDAAAEVDGDLDVGTGYPGAD